MGIRISELAAATEVELQRQETYVPVVVQDENDTLITKYATVRQLRTALASPEPPEGPQEGQLWFDENDDTLKIFDVTGNWIPVGIRFLSQLQGGGNDPNKIIGSDGQGGFELVDKPVAFSGNYSDLTGTPPIPTDVSDLTDTTGLIFDRSISSLTGAGDDNTKILRSNGSGGLVLADAPQGFDGTLGSLTTTDNATGNAVLTDGNGGFTTGVVSVDTSLSAITGGGNDADKVVKSDGAGGVELGDPRPDATAAGDYLIYDAAASPAVTPRQFLFQGYIAGAAEELTFCQEVSDGSDTIYDISDNSSYTSADGGATWTQNTNTGLLDVISNGQAAWDLATGTFYFVQGGVVQRLLSRRKADFGFNADFTLALTHIDSTIVLTGNNAITITVDGTYGGGYVARIVNYTGQTVTVDCPTGSTSMINNSNAAGSVTVAAGTSFEIVGDGTNLGAGVTVMEMTNAT